MINLSELKINNVEANLETGFFFVEFEDGRSLQCCLDAKGDEWDHWFISQIEVGNNGFNEASSADCNEWAVVDGGWDHIELFLIEQARANGVDIVA